MQFKDAKIGKGKGRILM